MIPFQRRERDLEDLSRSEFRAAARRIADDYRTGSGDVEVSTINSVGIIGDRVPGVPAADFRAVSLRDPKLVELILRLRGEE